MEVIKTDIEGVVIIEPKVFDDARGYFFESFSQREFEEKVRKINFVQDNEYVLIRSDAWLAFPETSLYSKQVSALRERMRP